MDRDPGNKRGPWRSRWAAIGAAVAVVLGAGGLYTVRADSAPSSFIAVTPTRVLDTRIDGFGGAFTSDEPRLLTVTGTIATVGADGETIAAAQVVPAEATAIVANVTAVLPSTAGFVSVRPGTATGAPTTSSINFTAGGVVAPNSVTVEVPTTGPAIGQIQLYFKGLAATATTHLLVDIVGFYQPGGAGAQGPPGLQGPAGPQGPAGNATKQQRLVTFTNGPTPVLTDTETQPAIALGADRVPIIAYFDDTIDDLYVVRCVAACGGATPAAIETTGSLGYSPSIAIGSDGLPIVVHGRQVDVPATPNLYVTHCTDVACTSRTVNALDGAAGATAATPTAIAIGSDGFPIVAYPLGSNVRTVHCGDVLCTPGLSAGTTHVTPVGDGSYISVVIGSDGLPVIAHQTANADLAVTRCANIACTSSTQVIADNQTVNVGYDVALAVGADGLPIIAHRILSDNTEAGSDLRITRCTDPTCSSAVSTTVDTGANRVGYFASIVIGADGVPIVAYRDDTAAALRIARCTDIACGAVEIVPNDAGPASGVLTSMVIDALGLPVIAHADTSSNSDIRLTIVTSQGWGP